MARCIALAISRLILKLFVVKHNMDRWVVGQFGVSEIDCLTEPSSAGAPDAGVKLRTKRVAHDARSRRQEQEAGNPIPHLALAPAFCFLIRGTRRASEIHP